MVTAAPLTTATRRLLRGVRQCVPARFTRWANRLKPEQRWALGEATRVCGEELLQFGRSSDKEFTALAQGLSSLNENLAKLRQHSAEFQLVLEDRDADRPIASAYEVYKRSVDIVHSSIGIASSEQEQMHGIEKVLLSACGASAQFRRNQLLLRLITMSIRMEAARMEPEHQTIFQNVGDAIGDITRKITASTEVAFQRIEAVITETCIERSLLHGIERDLHTRAQSSIKTIQHELTALQAALVPCAEQGRDIAGLFAETAPLTLRTLASLQHQDIVRQQLEHVAAGFDDLHQHIDETRSASSATARLELGYIHHAAGVQQAHLHSARNEIEKATDEVVGGLQAILATGATLVKRLGAMEKVSLAAFADFKIVAMFQKEISELASVADKSKETNGNISRLVGRIEEVVRVFAEEVGHHELDVKIVALNAQIAAARVASADALSRLAEETCRVSDDNTAVTHLLLADLQAGLAQLRDIKASADEFLSIVTEEKSELEKGVAAVTSKLMRMSSRVQTDVTEVRQDFEAVQLSTQRLLDQLGLAALIEQSFPPAEQLCAQLLAISADHSDRSQLSEEAAARLEAHRDRYTMQKENTTHAAVFATSTGTPRLQAISGPITTSVPAAKTTGAVNLTAPAGPDAATAENLGEGIELF
jgi:hypothetical protein